MISFLEIHVINRKRKAGETVTANNTNSGYYESRMMDLLSRDNGEKLNGLPGALRRTLSRSVAGLFILWVAKMRGCLSHE